MDQNTVLTDNIERKQAVGNLEKTAYTSLPTINGQRILIPEVSHLIKSVDRLTSHNFELLKMAKVPGHDIGTGR